MGLIEQQDAMAILNPHVRALRSIPLDAWDEYHSQIPKSILVAFCPRTRASGVHNLMVRNASKYADRTEGVRLFERQKMVGITIDGMLGIRLKKLDDESLSRNQPSQQVEDFRCQRQLDGIEAAHYLELGYVLNEEETEILEVRIAHPSGQGSTYWWVKLGDEGEASGTIELFTPPVGPEPQPPRIGPKKSDNVVPLRKKDDEN
jgi:hypothetical protein